MKRIIAILIFTTTCLNSLFAQNETTSFDVNGIKVIFKPTVKNMINVRVYFKGGVNNYTTQQTGIERLTLGAIIRCGTSKHTANEFKDIADYYDISLSNTAEYDYSQVEMSCISKYFDKGWELLAEAINSPAFNEHELQLLKDGIVTSIRGQETSPDKHIEQLLMKNAFSGTAYATDPDGTEESITGFTASDLKNYYGTMLNKNKMFIVIAGKITKQEIIDKILAVFNALPAAPYQQVALTAPTWNDNKTLLEQRKLSTNYINAILNSPVMTSPDYIPYKLGIAAFSGNLFVELRTKRNLSYDPGAYSANLRMPYSVMYISTTQPSEAVNVMMYELNRVKGLNISDKSLDEIKAGYITSNYIKLQSSSAITANLGVAEIMGGWEYFENTPAMLERVTSSQISNALKKNIVGVRWSYLGDAEAGNQAKESFNLAVK